MQEWLSNIDNSSVISNYKHFKTHFCYETYLDKLPKDLRFYFCRLRLSVHPLKIQTGRNSTNYIPRQQRYCENCDRNDLEDEFHFVCICPKYQSLRVKYIKKYYYIKPSMYKFGELLLTDNKIVLYNLAKYIKESLIQRSSYTIR